MTHDELPPIEILVHRHTGTVHAWPRDCEFQILSVVEENDILYGVHDLEEISDEDGGPTFESRAKRFRRPRNRLGLDSGTGRRSHHTKRRSFRDLN